MKEKFTIPLPELLESRSVYDGGFLKVRKDSLKSSDGRTYHLENVILRPYCVMVLAKDRHGRFILNQEYRHATGKVLLGCPGGLVDDGESPIEAAKRELLEETGFSAKDWKLIGEAYPAPGITGQKTYYLLADNAEKKSASSLEVSELVIPIALSVEEISRAIKEGAEIDGLLGTALFFYSLAKNS